MNARMFAMNETKPNDSNNNNYNNNNKIFCANACKTCECFQICKSLFTSPPPPGFFALQLVQTHSNTIRFDIVPTVLQS